MDSDDLRNVFDKAFAKVSAEVTSDLSYRHLVALADAFEEWALDKRRSAEQSAKLLAWSDRFRELADEAGPDWDPPKPERLSLIAFVGRKLLDE